MKSFAPVATLLFAASALAQSALTINTPINPPVCQPLRLSWSGGTAPYFLRVLPGNDPTGNTVLDFGQQSGTDLTWTVNVTVGTSLGLTLTDSTGTVAQSAAFTVQSSTDQSCLNAKTTAAGSSAAGGSTTAAGTTGAGTTAVTTPATSVATTHVTSATTPAGTSKASSAAGSSTASGASSSTSAKASSAATAQKATFGIAGAIGAAALALLA